MQRYHCYRFAECASTQRYVLDLPPGALPVLCTARAQSHGIGQRGQTWQSPAGNLYMSLRYPLPPEILMQSGLAQSVALTLAQTLDEEARILRLKWPNDLYIDGKKLGGILIDTGKGAAVIGIGINIVAVEESAFAFYNGHFPATTAEEMLKRILPALFACLADWRERPYLPVDHRWQEYDRFAGQTVTLEHDHKPYTLCGIDQKGRLIACDADNHLHFFTQTRLCIS